jgi:hypothetical protein
MERTECNEFILMRVDSLGITMWDGHDLYQEHLQALGSRWTWFWHKKERKKLKISIIQSVAVANAPEICWIKIAGRDPTLI